MTTHRLSLLREEYETTSITLEDLCVYHGVLLKELKGHKTWKKLATIVEGPDFSHLLVSEIEGPSPITITVEPEITEVPALPPTQLPVVVEEKFDIAALRETINDCKKLAIDRCKEFLLVDAKYAEIKEIKDVVAIVSDVDKSLQTIKLPEGSTVNVYINNLINNFRDDC